MPMLCRPHHGVLCDIRLGIDLNAGTLEEANIRSWSDVNARLESYTSRNINGTNFATFALDRLSGVEPVRRRS